jgi:hypothetical protein
VDDVNDVVVLGAVTALIKSPPNGGALGVNRQIYENHSKPAEAAKDILSGVWPWDVLNVHDDYGPWAEDLALQYAKDRNMIEYNVNNDPITWDNEADALRHFAWSARMTKEMSKEKAETVAGNHERNVYYRTLSGYVRFVPLENIMDEHNNAAGTEYADKLKSDDYAATGPYVKLFTEAKNDGKLILTLDDVYKSDPGLDKGKETELELKDLGVRRGLFFECDPKKEIVGQIDRTEAEASVKKYEEFMKATGMP